MTTESSAIETSRAAKRALSPRRRMLFRGLWVIYVIVLVVALGWAYRAHRLGTLTTSPTKGNEYWRTNYPELVRSGVLDAQLTPDDGYVDVLLLGASVLEDASKVLEQSLRDVFGDRLRVYQLCRAAHTSRDSYLKFQRIQEKHFDLIVIYDGVNDVRMNCCPDDEFRDDYTHCGWYRSMARKETAPTVTLAQLVEDETKFSIPLGEPDVQLLQYGDKVKTVPAFRSNLEAVVAAAKEQQTPVVLMTFAYYLPVNYTREKFEKRELDYGPGHYQLPAELWGKPENVARTLDEQNFVIDELAARYDNVIVVDQRKLLPADGAHFSDPCHLTNAGNRRFVDNMMPAILTRLKPASTSK